AVGRLPAQTTAVLSYVDPVTAILLATLFLHQPFGLAEACGTVLILGATLANELPGKAPSHS
ncbi:EamA family transporter, partial [Desulfovibrio piger]